MSENPIIPPPDAVLGKKNSIPSPDEILGQGVNQNYQELVRDGVGSYSPFGDTDIDTKTIIDNVPEINSGEKEILFEVAKKNPKDKDLISNSIAVLQGRHPKQDGGKGFYYLDEGVPVPLAPGEKPPAGKRVASIFGSDQEAQDDSWYTSLAKTMYNILPATIGNVADLAQTVYEGVTDNSSETLNTVANRMEQFSFKQKDRGPLYSTEGIKEFKDVMDADRWNLTPEAIYGTALELAGSVGEMLIPAGAVAKGLKGAKWAYKTADGVEKMTKAGMAVSGGLGSTLMNLGEVREAGREIGLEGRDLAVFSGPVAMAMAAVDVKLGLGAKILANATARAEKNAFVKQVAKDMLEQSGGKITEEALEKAVKETTGQYVKLASTWLKETGKDALRQGSDEALQDFIKQGGEMLWDNLTPSEKKKFGTDALSPEAFGSYVANFAAGMIGGAPTALAVNKVKEVQRDNEASKTVFGVVQKGDAAVKEFKANAKLELDRGALTQEQYENAVTKVNSYKEYNDIIGSRKIKLDEEKKREVFDKTFQKQNLESQIAGYGDPAKLNPIVLGEYNAKKKLADDIQKDINEILTDAQLKKENVVGKKTVDDAAKREEKENPTKPESPTAKKPKLSPALEALKERFGMKIDKDQKLFDEVKEKPFEEIPVNVFNDKKFNARDKHRVFFDFLKKRPNMSVEGKVIETPFEYKGKTNSVFEALMPDGRKIKFASSMKRGQWGRGWAEIGNKPRSLMTQDDNGFWHLDDKKIINAPIAMKAVPVGDGKRAIKVYLAQPGEDYGKFIGWVRATNTGRTKEFTREETDFLEEEEKKIEPPPSGGQVANIDPVAPAPIVDQAELEQQALNQNIEQNDNAGEIRGVEGQPAQAPSQEKPEAGDNNQVIPVPEAEDGSGQAERDFRQKVVSLQKRIKAYNRLNKKEKKNNQELFTQIVNEAKALEHDIQLMKHRNIRLMKDGKWVKPQSPPRPQEELERERGYKAKKNKALNASPISVRHMIVMDVANGVKFDKNDYQNRTQTKGKEDVPFWLIKDKGGVKFEFYAQRMAEMAGLEQREGVDTEAIANEAAMIAAEFAIAGGKEAALNEAIDIYERQINGGMNDAELADFIEANRIAEEKKGLDNVPDDADPYIDEFDELSEEELEELAEEQALFNEWHTVMKSQNEKAFVDFYKKMIRASGQYDPSAEKLYDQYFAERFKEWAESDFQYQKKSQAKRDNLKKIVDAMKRAMPKVNIIYDPTLKAAGVLQGNTIAINPYYAGEDTAIHEVAHVLIDAMGNNKVVKAAIAQLKGTALWNETAERYPELSEAALGNEVLAEAIGREGAGIFESETDKSKFRVFLDYIFDWFKQKLGLDKNIAKSLARQIIQGRGTKELTGTTEVAQEQKKDPEFDKFRSKVLGADLEEEQGIIDFVEEQLENNDDELSDEDIEILENARDAVYEQIEEDRAAYAKFKASKAKAEKIKTNEDLDAYELDDLIQLYNDLKDEEESTKEVKFLIADYLQQTAMKRLSENKDFTEDKVHSKDMTWGDVWFSSMSNIDEKFPEIQELANLFEDRYLSETQERAARKRKLEKLGKAVIKERNTLLGRVGDVFTSDSAKYFDFVEDNGELRTNTAGLTNAQREYLDYFTELVEERNKNIGEDFVESSLVLMDKGFQETFRTEGILAAISVYLGGNSNPDTEVTFTDSAGNKRKETYYNAQKEIIEQGKKGKLAFAKALFKLIGIAYQAKKGADTNAYVNYKGKLTYKTNRKRPEGKSYSKDFYRAADALIDDIAHVKYMNDLVPVVDAVESFYKNMGVEKGKPFDNTLKFLQEWRDEQIYQKKKVTDPVLDATLKFLRKLTSATVMGFNIPANIMNTFVGNYNAWRQEGLKHWAIGQKRLFSGTKRGGYGAVNKKALEILKHYDIVATDLDHNPKQYIGKLFDQIAFAGGRWAETQIQGSHFLGFLDESEWNSFDLDSEGNLTLKDGVDKKAFDRKMNEYKEKVAAVQGKYALKDRRNFMRFEAGRSMGQFRIWLPEAWKSRFGAEFIDKNGNTRRGSWNMFTDTAVRELKADIAEKGHLKAFWDNKMIMANLKGAMVTAWMLALVMDDDDEKKRKEVLSLDNALSNLLMVFDPQQTKYMLSSPAAGLTTLSRFIDALDAAIRADNKRFEKNAKRLIPFNKLADLPEQVEELTK